MLLESIRLVNQFGGLDKAKLLINTKKGMGYLKQAIADYEAIYSIPESVRQAILNLEMHL